MHEDQACCSADSGITAHQLYLSVSYIYLLKESCRNWAKRSVYRQGTIWEQFCDEGNTTALTPWFSCVYLCNSRTEEGSRVSATKSHGREGKRLPVTRTRMTMSMPGKKKKKIRCLRFVCPLARTPASASREGGGGGRPIMTVPCAWLNASVFTNKPDQRQMHRRVLFFLSSGETAGCFILNQNRGQELRQIIILSTQT